MNFNITLLLTRHFFLFILLSLFTYTLSAQSKWTDDLEIRANYHYGFVLPEYQNFIYLVDAPIQSFELGIVKQATGKNDWQQLYHYPAYGVSLFYSTLGNKEVNGQELALYPYFILHLISKKRFSLDNQIGIGIGYTNKKFDLNNNYQNVAVGSNFNIHFNLKLGAKYQLLKHISLGTGLSFDHFSNGNLEEPNLGINSLTFYGGASYLLGNKSERITSEISPHSPSYELEAIYSVGSKHARALQSSAYFTSSFSFDAKRKLFRTFYMGIGADLFYDSSTEAEMQGEVNGQYKPLYGFRSGIHLSQEFVYNRLSITLQEGVYLLLTNKVDDSAIYNRAKIRYRFTKHLSFNLSMKSHLHILDYPEFGIGYYW